MRGWGREGERKIYEFRRSDYREIYRDATASYHKMGLCGLMYTYESSSLYPGDQMQRYHIIFSLHEYHHNN